jgi:putative flippase GtrA
MTPDDPAAPTQSRLRHMLGFLISGILAFITDVGIAKGLNVFLGWPWPISRLLGIAGAMLVAWLAHRNLTFAVKVPPSVREFVRYAGLASSTAVLNYVIFLAVLWMLPNLDGSIAIGISSLVAMVYSYAGMRFGVFHRNT